MNFSIHNTFSYNTFKSPHQITEYFDFNDEDNKEVINFTYNAFNQRSARYYGGNRPDKYNRSKRKYYSGIAPIEISQDVSTGKSKVVYFIGGDAYQAPVAYEEKFIGNSSEDGRFLYLHRDYLGTIFAITKDAPSGNMPTSEQDVLVERRHFDAWGGLVLLQKEGETEAAFYDEVKFNDELYLDRGYTGHEHLASVSLIHMNGRLYDAKLRRFLAPDNFIQDPYNTQNFNRYAYVYNNPLIYNDPSGEFIISAAIIIGTYGILSAVNGSLNPANWDTASQVIFTVVASVATAGALAGWKTVGSLFTKAAWAKGGFAHNAILGTKLTALKGNMVAGTLNFAYNYNGNVLNSLGYFAAGFFGSAIGTGTGLVWKGMAVGGALNIGATSLASDFEGGGTLYQMSQKFVGGALSSLAGMNVAKMEKAQYLGEISGLGKKSGKGAGKLLGSIHFDKGLNYGLNTFLSNFAYMDREDFKNLGWGGHFRSFGASFFNGMAQATLYGFKDDLNKFLYSGLSMAYYMADGIAQFRITSDYHLLQYKGKYEKIGIFSLKSYGFNPMF